MINLGNVLVNVVIGTVGLSFGQQLAIIPLLFGCIWLVVTIIFFKDDIDALSHPIPQERERLHE